MNKKEGIVLSKKELVVNKIEKLFEKEAIQIRKKITSELTPFLDGIRILDTCSRNYKLFKEAYMYFAENYVRKKEIFSFILGPKSISVSDVEGQIYTLFAYLGAIESLGNSIVDILVMLLVANGRDFHIESRYRTPRIKHVTSVKDLEKERVSLTTKLHFLKDNGIKKLASIIDSKLRNAIAHLKIHVKKDEIFVKGRPASEITLISLKKLFVGVSTTEMLLNQLAKEKGWVQKI